MSAALFDFVPVWTLILGAGIFYYVLFDGFDLGVGMLYGVMPDARVPQYRNEYDRAGVGRQ